MTQEEAQGFLHALEAGLAEFGATELADQSRRAARDEGDEFDSRAMLALLLEEIESVLVDAPRMVSAAMKSLGAEQLAFSTDRRDVRFNARGDGLVRLIAIKDDVTITMNTLQPLLGNAEQAAVLIAELRGRI
ncbi:hypothetical protein [Novosphingobium nitrogenifigens]|nr:hypothetical protein [Novosphingobium nitrogenifigens]